MPVSAESEHGSGGAGGVYRPPKRAESWSSRVSRAGAAGNSHRGSPGRSCWRGAGRTLGPSGPGSPLWVTSTLLGMRTAGIVQTEAEAPAEPPYAALPPPPMCRVLGPRPIRTLPACPEDQLPKGLWGREQVPSLRTSQLSPPDPGEATRGAWEGGGSVLPSSLSQEGPRTLRGGRVRREGHLVLSPGRGGVAPREADVENLPHRP